MFGFGESVTLFVRSSAAVDGYGDDVETFTPVTVDGCAVDPGGSTEVVADGDTVTSTPKLYAPAGTVVGPLDEVERADGSRYRVQGDPAMWSNPFTGATFGVVIDLERVTG